MIVTMRQDIQPQCDKHFVPMKLFRFGDPTGAGFKAYQCEVSDCTRAYNSSLGLFDIAKNGGPIMQKHQQGCQQDGTPMFLERVEGETEVWRCAQVGCNYSQTFLHQYDT